MTPEIPANRILDLLGHLRLQLGGRGALCVTVIETIGTSMFGKRVIGQLVEGLIAMKSNSTKARIGAIGLRMAQRKSSWSRSLWNGK